MNLLERHPKIPSFLFIYVPSKLGLSKESINEVVYDGPYYSSIINHCGGPCAGVNITILLSLHK